MTTTLFIALWFMAYSHGVFAEKLIRADRQAYTLLLIPLPFIVAYFVLPNG